MPVPNGEVSTSDIWKAPEPEVVEEVVEEATEEDK